MTGSTFSVTKDTYEDDLGREIQVASLRNTATGELAEVLLNTQGGMNRSNGAGAINGVLLRDPLSQKLREVMPHRRGYVGGLMAPFANRVRDATYVFEGHRYQLTRNWDETQTRISRTGQHAIHGLLPTELQHVGSEANSDAAMLILAASLEGLDDGYPFPVQIACTYSLSQSGFSIAVAAMNRSTSGQSAPFMVGWHPYLQLEGPVSRAVLAFDERSAFNRTIPVGDGPAGPDRDSHPVGRSEPSNDFKQGWVLGDRYWDDGFKAVTSTQSVPRLETRVTDDMGEKPGSDILLWQDPTCRFIQVYTGLRDRGAVAIEPMSGQTDCFNNGDGLVVLQAGERWETAFGVCLDVNP